MIDAALIADGGELSVMRPLAAYAFGAWTVTWPDDFDAPELEDERRLGFVADLPERRKPGRLARRFTRVDAEINAVDGGSNVEEILDEAAQRTAGREFFEREIGPAGFGRLVPGVDVRVNDRKPVVLWRRILPDQLVTELRFNGDGTATAQVGGQPVSDDLRRLAANRENDQKILSERREAEGAVRAVSRAATRAVRRESDAREEAIATEARLRKSGLELEAQKRAADLRTIRDFLGGSGASQANLVSQLAAINSQIIGMSSGSAPPPGLLNSYMAANTLLWEQQREINRLNEKFKKEQTKVSAANSAALHAQDLVIQGMPRMVHVDEGRASMWSGSEGTLSYGGDLANLYFTSNIGGGAINFEARGKWTGAVWVMAVTRNGDTDVKAATITSSDRFFNMKPNNLGGYYKAATAWIFPDVKK
ncbi:hypothetical protein [Corynebacterium sp. p3-SID1194]|uniref:hypothetical protein n=1 Tax=Corynebacterium sp. p3-SID1194 TaxID=2916105 RepID=UPI0021A8B202|nr:hypothetical protein [Corynebacterium sp. p3-SID1194]MCT1450652.1 hypothetical protein [Corynebacterium sp. p3-SID1194]